MKRIYKYPLAVTDEQTLILPEGFEILSVQVQGDGPKLWAIVDPDATEVPVKIAIYGTGHPIEDDVRMTFIDTFQMMGGSLIFHVFKEA